MFRGFDTTGQWWVMCVGFGATLGPPSGPCALKDCQQLDQQMQAAQQDLLRGQGLNEQQAAEIKSQATLCDSLRGGRPKDPTNFNMNWDMLLFCSGGNMGLRIGCPNSFDGQRLIIILQLSSDPSWPWHLVGCIPSWVTTNDAPSHLRNHQPVNCSWSNLGDFDQEFPS